jgi:hypothetical protein
MRGSALAIAMSAALLSAIACAANAQPADAAATETAAGVRAGNPLWTVPLDGLAAQQERPLFSPTRRPPPPQQVAAPPPAAPRPAPAPPAAPPLQLLGVISGGDGGFGLFTNSVSGATLTLRAGEVFGGWTLRALHPRSAVVISEGREVVLALPDPDMSAAAEEGDAPAKDPGDEPIFYPEH